MVFAADRAVTTLRQRAALRRLGKDLIREAEERGAKWAIDATNAAYARMKVQKGLQPLDPIEVCEEARARKLS